MSSPLITVPATGPGSVGPHDPKDTSRYANNKLAMPSAMRAAQAELRGLNDTEEASLLEGFSSWLRRSGRARGDGVMSLETPAESASEYLEGLLKSLGDSDFSSLEALLQRFPGLEKSSNPLAHLLSNGLKPGQAALLLAALVGGFEDARWQKLREKFKSRRGPLKKALDAYLRENGSVVGVSLFSFLEFGDDEEQQEGLKSLYRYASDSCRTMADLFKHLMELEDREAKLRAVLRAIALELSSIESPLSKEQARLISIIKDMQRVLILFGLNATCEKTAKQLETLGSRTPTSDDVLRELISTAELAWVEADWLEGRLAMLFGTGKIEEKLVCAREFKTLWKKMPSAFFDDQEKRKEVLNAFDALLQMLEKQENESL